MLAVITVWPFAYNYVGGHAWSIFAVILVLAINTTLISKDAEQFEEKERVSRWLAFFTPLYLLMRDLKRKAFPVWAVASVCLLAFSLWKSTDMGFLMANEPVACTLVTRIINENNLSNNLGECKSLKIGEAIAEDVYSAKSVTTKGAVLNLTVTFNREKNQVYARVSNLYAPD